MALINRPNHVIEKQRHYQAAYRNHQRIWAIHPVHRFLVRSFSVVLAGTVTLSVVGLGRKALGYNSYF